MPTGTHHYPAPELDVAEWIGTPHTLEELRGKVVLIEVFQMLCPGCVRYGIPQAQKVHRAFPKVTVLGLHSVFEHHEAMGLEALKVFLSEFRITFPVAVDRQDGGMLPVTMRKYGLEGTPSTLIVDQEGGLAFSHLGQLDDMVLGGLLGELLGHDAG